MDEECNMTLCEFELEEDDNTDKFVEYPELRTQINYLCPDAIMISRNTVKADKVGRSQLDTYLDEPTLDFDYLEQMDVLEIC